MQTGFGNLSLSGIVFCRIGEIGLLIEFFNRISPERTLLRSLIMHPQRTAALSRFCGKTTCCGRRNWTFELGANAFLVRQFVGAAVRERSSLAF